MSSLKVVNYHCILLELRLLNTHFFFPSEQKELIVLLLIIYCWGQGALGWL